MILSWKILWFQRVSEHVLELGHYEIKESKVCITHFDCLTEKNKHILYILSFSILMKVYLCCFFPMDGRFTCSLDADFIDIISCFVFAKKENGKFGKGCFCDLFESYSTVKMLEYVYSKESTYPPTVWPVVIQYTVFLCLFEHFLLCWSRRCWGQDYLIGIVMGAEGVGRKDSTFHTQTQSVPFRKSAPRIRSNQIRDDAVILGEEYVW